MTRILRPTVEIPESRWLEIDLDRLTEILPPTIVVTSSGQNNLMHAASTKIAQRFGLSAGVRGIVPYSNEFSVLSDEILNDDQVRGNAVDIIAVIGLIGDILMQVMERCIALRQGQGLAISGQGIATAVKANTWQQRRTFHRIVRWEVYSQPNRRGRVRRSQYRHLANAHLHYANTTAVEELAAVADEQLAEDIFSV